MTRPRFWTDEQEASLRAIDTGLALIAQQLRLWLRDTRMVRPAELSTIYALLAAVRDDLSTLKPRFRK